MTATIKRFLKEDDGATAIEYGLIAALISIGIITAATTLGSKISETFDYISTQLTSATAP